MPYSHVCASPYTGRVWYGRMVLPPAAAVLPLAHGQDLTYGQWRAQMRDDAAAGHLTTDGAYGQTRALGWAQAPRRHQDGGD